MMLAEKYIPYYTLEDYQHWGENWELIYGYPYAISPSPLVTHQNINMKIARQLSKALDNCPHCQALFEIDGEVSSDTVVKPDTLVICYEPDEKITKKPELILRLLLSQPLKKMKH